MGWRIDADDEAVGIDQAEHAESEYDCGGFAAGSRIPHSHGPNAGAGSTIGAEHNDPTGLRA